MANFRSHCVYEASFVWSQTGIVPILKTEDFCNGRVGFEFPRVGDVETALLAFHSGLEVDALEFSKRIKKLRARMFDHRGEFLARKR